jgi:hypothetical protein
MSDHDPLCERGNAPNYSTCYCTLIARVREDERENVLRDAPVSVFVKAHTDGKAVGYAKGRADALADAREAVAALDTEVFCYDHDCRMKRASLAAIDALRLDNSRQHLNKMVTEKLDLYDKKDVYFNQHGQGENP